MIQNLMVLLFLFTSVWSHGLDMTEAEFEKFCGSEEWTELDFADNQSDEYYKSKAHGKCALAFSNLPNEQISIKVLGYITEPAKVKMIKVSNELNFIYPYGFSQLKNIKFLNLSGAIFQESEILEGYGMFSKMLEWLDLSNNSLKSVGFLQEKSMTMKKLNLDDNKLEELPLKTLKNFWNLEEISVSRNKVKKFYEHDFEGFSDKSFSNFLRVKYLDVSYNQLEDLDGLEYFPSVVYLNLSNNRIKELKGVYFESETNSLKELNLDGNRIGVLSIETLLNMPSLQKLSLEGNSLNEIIVSSKRKYWNTKLEYLNLGRNELRIIPYNFLSYYPTLKILKLSRNRLKHLSQDMFANLKNLESLDLSYNEITVLDVTKFEPLKSLTYLNLKGNEIESIDYIPLLSYLPNLQNISFSSNPLRCDNLIEMLNFLNDTSIGVNTNGSCTYEAQFLGFCCKSNSSSKTSSDNILQGKVNVTAADIVRQNERNFKKTEILLEMMYNRTLELENALTKNTDQYLSNYTLLIGIIFLIVALFVFVFAQIVILKRRRRKYNLVAR